jgi:hypothetical protein
MCAMVRCSALVRMGRSRVVWLRCEKRAMRKEIFCAVHRDALNGTVTGLLQYEQLKRRRIFSRRCCASVQDTRETAAAKTTPARLEPDPE